MTADELRDLLSVELEEHPLVDTGVNRWRPTYGATDASVAVHVATGGEIGPSIRTRIASAAAAGVRVAVALDRGLTDLEPASQAFLLATPVEILAPDLATGDGAPARYDSFATAVVNQAIYLDDEIVRDHIVVRLREAEATTGAARGKALERALALAASQVPGWRVRDMNLNTSNEEIDILVANSSAQSPWNGSPFILFESKNWTDAVDRVEYDAFHMKVKERGGFCRIGFFFAAGGYSGGFYKRAAHHGAEGFSIVPITTGWLIERLSGGGALEQALTERVERVVIDREWEE